MKQLRVLLLLIPMVLAVIEHGGQFERPEGSGGATPNEVLAAHAPRGRALLKPGAGEGMPVGFEDGDEVEVYYAEHVLAAWVLQGSPWTAFHSGFSFKNKRNQETYCIDYCPVYTQDVRVVLAPELTDIPGSEPKDLVTRTRKMLGLKVDTDADMRWQNQGLVRFYTSTPAKYTNLTHLADISGSDFHNMVSWAMEYNNTYNTFDPVEIVIEGKPERRVSSRMCHDLVTAGLWFLYEHGVNFE